MNADVRCITVRCRVEPCVKAQTKQRARSIEMRVQIGWRQANGTTARAKRMIRSSLDAQQYLRRLLEWRKRTLVVQHGKLQHFAPADSVHVYFRCDGDDTVMVALNHNAEAVPLALDRFGDFIGAKSRGHDVMTGAGVTFDKPLSLAAK